MRKEKRTVIGGQFSGRLIEMMESPAFRALSLSAHRILNRVELEHAHHGGTDNGRLPVTYDQFEEYGIHRHAIRPAIRECIALGFLEVTVAGVAGNAEHRSPNMFRLTYRYAQGDHGRQGTNEWRKVASIEEAMQRSSQSRKGRDERPYRIQKPSGGKRQFSVAESALKTAVS